MKKLFFYLFTLLSTGSIFAYTLNVTDLGAIGNGSTDNTAVFQEAIDKCSAQSGTVFVPAGKYLTRTLFLKSNVHLQLDFGAEILGSTDLQSYLHVFPNRKGKESPALIYARNVENIAITGLGTINGQGQHENFQLGNDSKHGPIRPKIIYFVACKNVKIQDITLINSAYWTQDYEDCDGVIIKGIKVRSHANWNNDGLDIDSKNVVVSDCNIDCDDDAICLKSDTHEVCENISITNCVLKTNCNAIKFGTSSYAGFKNVTVSNCVISKASEDRIRQWHINEPWMGTSDKTVVSGIALESVDGGVMEQIMVSNIVMSDVQTPIFIRLGDRKRSVTKHISRLKNISISNIIAEAESKVACSITGVPGGIVENVLISDVFLTVPGGGSETDLTAEIPEQIKNYPENRMFNAILPASGFYVRHAQNIRFKNIEVKTKNTDARPMFYLEDTSDVEILHSTFNGEEATVKIHSPSSASLLSRPSQTSN